MTRQLRRQVALAGRVVDGTTHARLAGAVVTLAAIPASLETVLAAERKRHGPAWERLDRRPDRAITDATGTFVFLDLPSGAYALTASLPGGGRRYGAAKAKARVKRNKAGDLDHAWVELALPASGVAGKVTGADAKPVALASVRVKDGGERVFTDAKGQFVLSGVEPGARTLVVDARGFATAEQPVALAKPGATKTVTVVLSPAGS